MLYIEFILSKNFDLNVIYLNHLWVGLIYPKFVLDSNLYYIISTLVYEIIVFDYPLNP
jgi:hypothetical protein